MSVCLFSQKVKSFFQYTIDRIVSSARACISILRTYYLSRFLTKPLFPFSLSESPGHSFLCHQSALTMTTLSYKVNNS